MRMRFLKRWSHSIAAELPDTFTLLPPSFGIPQVSFSAYNARLPTFCILLDHKTA